MGQFIIETLFGELISSGVDVSKNGIKAVIEKREYKSIHTQIYHVIFEALCYIADDSYSNNLDVIYGVAENLLKSLKNNQGDDIESIKFCLKEICSDVSDELCEHFQEILYEKVFKKENEALCQEIILRFQKQTDKKTDECFQKVYQKLEEMKQILDKKEENTEKNANIQNNKFSNNKKKEYVDNWNSKLFLHQHNEERPLTLANTFIVPDYKIEKSISWIGFSKKDTLDNIIDKFIEYDKRSTMLITGVPGIGKSSVTSWIANKYKDNDNLIILKFRDWEKKELEKGLLKAIYCTLKCKKIDLEHKILILDGFDEMKLLENREVLLNGFFNEILDLQGTRVIITSRPTYINSSNFDNVLELLVFDIEKIKNFYYNITNITLNIEIINNEQVLGIPVILYMAIMSNIDITKSTTKSELYSRIFAENSGIFDKFYYEGISYSEGEQILRNSENIKYYLEFLCNTAFTMFEKDSLLLSKGEYKIPPLQFQGVSISILEFPIKYLFENTETNIEFIHKSIYEYFVSEYIFRMLCQNINIPKEKLACILGSVLKSNVLSIEVLEFLKFRISNNVIKSLFNIMDRVFRLMIQDGMTYYTDICYKNVIKCERNVFVNMLEILHLFEWEMDYLKLNESIYVYLIHGSNDVSSSVGLNLEKMNLTGLNLNNICLIKANLIEAKLVKIVLTDANLIKAKLIKAQLIDANLTGANLTNADLRGARLTRANLTEAKLIDADLRGAKLIDTNLTRANLTKADFTNAILDGTIFDVNQVRYLKNKYDLSKTRVYIKKIDKTVGYIEYENIIEKDSIKNKRLK